MASANSSFDVLASTTLKNYRSRLTESITDKARILKHLREGGYVREESGGTSLVEPLLYGTNSTVKSYFGYDVIDTTPAEGISAAEFNWKQVAGSVTISGSEEFQNMGSKTQIIKLLDAKIKQLELSMSEAINTMLFSDGTGNGGKDIVGLALAVEDGAAWSTYAGIDSNVYTFWRNKWIDASGTPSFATSGADNMRTMYHNVSRANGDKPTIIITTQTVFERYEKTLVVNERYTDLKVGDSGFLSLVYKDVPIFFDEDCQAGYIYFLNKQYLSFVVGSGRYFTMTDFQKPENQDAKVAQILLYAQLTMNRRAAHGVITGQTAA
jgi:hypothetical protein